VIRSVPEWFGFRFNRALDWPTTGCKIEKYGMSSRSSYERWSPNCEGDCYLTVPKAQLRGIRFQTSEEFRRMTQNIIATFDRKWYSETFQKWIRRHRSEVCAHRRWLHRQKLTFDVECDVTGPVVLFSVMYSIFMFCKMHV
jgi:hypothetical protein